MAVVRRQLGVVVVPAVDESLRRQRRQNPDQVSLRASEIRVDVHFVDPVVVVRVLRAGEHPVSGVEQLLVLLQHVDVTQTGLEALEEVVNGS